MKDEVKTETQTKDALLRELAMAYRESAELRRDNAQLLHEVHLWKKGSERLDTDYYDWEEYEGSPLVEVMDESREISIGADYYNMDSSNDDEIGKFISRHTDTSLSYISKRDFNIIKQDQPTYKQIADRIIEKDTLSRDELDHIGRWLEVMLIQRYDAIECLPIAAGLAAMSFGPLIRHSYRWLVLLSTGKVEVGRCALGGCDRIFTLGGSGSQQKYCSVAHKMRAYRRRLKRNSG